MAKVYVTAHEGRYIPGLGSRRLGEFFEVDDNLAAKLLKMEGFGTKRKSGTSELAESTAPVIAPDAEDKPTSKEKEKGNA